MKTRQGKYLHSRCSELEETLRMLVSADQTMAFRSEKLRNVFRDAADLAKTTHLSRANYQYAGSCSTGETLFWDEFRRFKIIDQANAQPIRNSDTMAARRDGRIGEKLRMVQPALVRKGKNGGRDITLFKATILCNFDHPVVRRKKTKKVAVDATAQYQAGDSGDAELMAFTQ
jgi:hypothetical protein